MTDDRPMEVWDLWFPEAAATGMPFARGRLQAAEVLLVHSAPAILDVQVRSDRGDLLAEGKGLRRTADRPMLRLRRRGREIIREDVWPTQADHGCPVLLPGGEVGILLEWWNAVDESEWRWRIELYNHR